MKIENLKFNKMGLITVGCGKEYALQGTQQ